MSVLRGTADNYLDLVARLDAFLTQQGHAWGRTYTGTGDGRLLGTDGSEGGYIGGPDSVAETFTLTATGASTFTVEGTVTGALPDATVGTPYVVPQLEFLLEAGSTAFQAGDRFTINTTPPWERIIRRGVLEAAFRTGVNFQDVQNVYSTNQGWYATATGANPELRLEMVWPSPVEQYVVGINTTATAPTGWTLDYSDDGTAWTTADTRTGLTWGAGFQMATFTVPGNPGEHRFWRLRFTSAAGPSMRVERFLVRAAAADEFTLEAGAFLAWRAPGADGEQEINLAARLYSDQGLGTYNLRWYGSRFWDASKPPEAQTNSSGERVVSLYNSPMPFTFVANGHRVIPVVKVGTFYVASYLGFRRSYEPPSADPWPCVVAGTHNVTTQNYSTINGAVHNFWQAGRDSMVAHYPNGTWVRHSNRYNSGGAQSDGAAESDTTVWTGRVYPFTVGATAYGLSYARENLDGSYTLIPATLLCIGPRHAAGELDGVYWLTGFNNTAENIVRRNGFDHLCFPNINRTGGGDFAAIRLD